MGVKGILNSQAFHGKSLLKTELPLEANIMKCDSIETIREKHRVNKRILCCMKCILPCVNMWHNVLIFFLFGIGLYFLMLMRSYNNAVTTQVLMRHALEYTESISKTMKLLDKYVDTADKMQCFMIPETLRFDCHPEDGVSELSCRDRGCCWNPINKNINDSKKVPLNVPYCYYPDTWRIYKYENFSKEGNDFSGFMEKLGNSFYGHDLTRIKIEGTSIDNSTFRLKIYDPSNARYEPPWPIRADPQPFTHTVTNATYRFHVSDIKPGFKLDRVSDNTTIFNSIGMGGFIFADQFLQISTWLPSANIYGFGEHRTNLKLDTNWQILTIFNKDQPPTEHANLYGSHPFYLVIEDSGNCHGVLFLNSNAMDIILQPTPAITFRTIGGIFDMYFFLGPTPADVLKQYSEIVGKPFLPPYWSLGFHLCRYGYGSLERTIEVWNRTRAAGIPFDTQWNDLDYMDKNNDFTYNKDKFKDLPKFVDEVHRVGMHYIPLIDAGVSASEGNGSYPPYDEGLRDGVFVQDGISNTPFSGKVWNLVSTVWPDFTNPKTRDYYLRMMRSMHNSFAFDGAWIDMNEPSNFYNGHKDGCARNDLDYPKYTPNVVGNLLSTKTLCMNARHYLGHHYNLHNTYGTSQAIVTNYALKKIRNKRPFIISRSTWEGHGHYAGHWTGDVYSSWHDLRMSVPEVLSYSLFQLPMVGADICGFDGNATAALCNRWMQLGAFYPFSRNHNSDDTTEQDPVAMGDLVVRSSRKALKTRYWLLPYLYTLFYRAHKFGETVARPLFFEFTDDPATYNVDTQFLWGSCVLINPVLEEYKEVVEAYVPRGLWYNLYTKKPLFSIGRNIVLRAPLDAIPILIRGGSIIPTQKPATTTTESRKHSFELFIALDQFSRAEGELYWDDGDSLDSIERQDYAWIKFRVQSQSLRTEQVEKKAFYKDDMILGKIRILGIAKTVSRVFLNNNEIKFVYDSARSCLIINGLLVDLKKDFILSWQYLSAYHDNSQRGH